MRSSSPNEAGSPGSPDFLSRLFLSVIIGIVLVALIAILLPRPKPSTGDANAATGVSGKHGITGSSEMGRPTSSFQRRNAFTAAPAASEEEIVAGKVRKFGQSRRAIAERIARRLGKELPPEIEGFFDAIERGNWDEIESRWKELATHTHQYEYSKDDRPDLEPFWATVLDAYGVAEQAHDWPAQKLLDYGNAVLDSLRPGMVYVGGTDNGRWVPELLNETSGREPHIMVTQNALADGTYLDFVRELYGDRFNALSPEDSQKAFAEYNADAQKRFEHDQNFPDEPKEVRPGENISIKDGKVQVSGQVAVMAINERILQALMEKNPDLSFAIQESFSLPGTYADALPLGPLMELRAQKDENRFTTERAAQSVQYWRDTAENILANPEALSSTTTLKAYSKDINSTANLLAAHHFTAEAEQAYRLSAQVWPGNPEPVTGLAKVLAGTGRVEEADRVLDDFSRAYPDQRQSIEAARPTVTFLWTAPAK